MSSYVLPIAALAIGPAFALARIVRVEGLKVLEEDYIRTARGKRLPARLIYLRHGLPNMLTATLTISGLLLGGLIAGTVLIETIFGWTGLGTTLVNSVTDKDYPTVQAVAVVFGTFILLVNFVVDMALAAINPQSTILEQ
jgi:peptide/nickel transport system permease protein